MRRPSQPIASSVLGLILAGVVGAALLGCARDTAPAMLSSARAKLQAGHSQAAVIELKGALQLEPDFPEARLLLGTTLLDQGQAAPALIELEKASALGMSDAKVWPATARAMLALGQSRQLAERFKNARPTAGDASADLQTSVASAYAAQGLRAQAWATLQPVLQESPKFAPALLLQARLSAANGDIAQAQSQVDQLLSLAPQNPHAWQLRGDLLARQNLADPDAALAYRRALSTRPDQLPAHAGLIAVLLRTGDVAAARQQADAMLAAGPADPLSAFAGAQVAFAEGNYTRARTLGQSALRAQPEHAQLLQFVGLTELRLGAPLAAEPPLLKSLQLAPKVATTRHLLAGIYLSTGQEGKVEPVLEPLLQHADPEALLQLARARQQTGQAQAAQALLQGAQAARRAASSRPEKPDGPQARDGAEAQAALASDRLIVEQLVSSRQLEAAQAALDDLQARQPAQAETTVLQGRLLLARRDAVGARKAFEQALEQAATDKPGRPAVLAPALALAALDAQAGQTAAAAARLQALTQAHPEDASAALALASLLERDGDRSDRAPTLLAQAVREHPGDPRTSLAYARHLQRKGKTQTAELVLKDAASAMPGNADLLDALTRAQLSEREFGQALLTINKWLSLRPDASDAQLRLAEAQVGLGAIAPARQALQRALVLRPDSLQAQRGLVSLALIEGRPQVALALARQVQKQRGALGLGLLLEGDVLLASGNTRDATAAYLDGLQRAPGVELAAKAHAMLIAQKQTDAAAALEADWRRSHPRDADFAVHLGNGALARGDAASAERHYLEAIDLQPLHGLALNNLATAMLQLGHRGALAYAERAAAQLPDSAAVLDTLASARRAERSTVWVSAPGRL